MTGEVFSGETLAEALESGALEQPATTLVGMVKPSEQDAHVAFARGGCDSWIDVPTTIIERAEHIGTRPCEDHSHPVLRITLKETNDPQAKLLGAMVGTGRSPVGTTLPMRRSPRGGLRPRGLAQRTAASIHSGGPFAALCWGGCDLAWIDCIGFGGDVELCASIYNNCMSVCDFIGSLESIFY